MRKHTNDSIIELEKFIDRLIKRLDRLMFFNRIEMLNDDRKKYLLDLFYDIQEDSFHEKPKEYWNRWFKVFNGFEMNFVHMINLHRLSNNIERLINLNIRLTNEDRYLLKKECFRKLDMIATSIHIKGISRYRMDTELGVDLSSDGKNIIFGRLTPWEFFVNFLSFWSIIKSLLTVSLVPIIISLINTDKKPIIYIFLGIAYLIVSVLSDKEQSENVIDFLLESGWDKERQSAYYIFFM